MLPRLEVVSAYHLAGFAVDYDVTSFFDAP
jgi:hypothetical protein